ncbi:MAG: hypothetical protein FJZ16_04620 [Candidatus Omnitrophica bacterium]|nr:hypothetical protein [Candidatus Omnitrophota bacterium]
MKNIDKVHLKEFFRNWRWVITYIALIYINLPFLPFLWNNAIKFFGKRFDYFPSVLLFLFGFVIIFYTIFVLKCRRFLLYLYLGLIAVLVSLVFSNLKLAVERIHLFEYGLLPFLIGHSLKKQGTDRYSSLRIFLIGFIVGIVDEFIQIILPNRYCTISDILLNSVSVFLGLLAWKIISSRPNQKISGLIKDPCI